MWFFDCSCTFTVLQYTVSTSQDTVSIHHVCRYTVRILSVCKLLSIFDTVDKHIILSGTDTSVIMSMGMRPFH